MKHMRQIDCEQALARIFDFVDRELHGEERQALQHHLDTCRSCCSRAEFEARLKLKLRALRNADPRPEARERVRRLLKAL